jgi:hypothetical protein
VAPVQVGGRRSTDTHLVGNVPPLAFSMHMMIMLMTAKTKSAPERTVLMGKMVMRGPTMMEPMH